MDLTAMQAMSPENQIAYVARQLHETQMRMNRLALENEEMRNRIDSLEARERARKTA